MQPFEFSLGIWGSEITQKPDPEKSGSATLLRRPETIPGKLLSSRARFRFVSGIHRKPISGLCRNRKLIGGQTI
jgi:hypothetical protein